MATAKLTDLLLPVTLLASFGMGLGCKYDANPPEGVQECYELKCPDGYQCGVDNRCYTPSHLPAVSPGTGGTLAGEGGKTVAGTGGSGTGGAKGTGGKAGSGGVVGTGGVTGRGGSTIVGSGGVTGRGGVSGTGGLTISGGTISTGGTTTPPNSGTTMTIANGQAQGAMTGFGWVALGSADTVTDPTCDSPQGAISSSTTCNLTKWSMPNAYCISGTIPLVTSSSEYTTNWGILLGINCTPVEGSALGQSFSSLTVATSGSPTSGLRLQVHRKGDTLETTYCANMSPGVAVSFSSFNTTCWDNKGTYLMAADVPNLDYIAMSVPSSPNSAITVTGLCITGITFAK